MNDMQCPQWPEGSFCLIAHSEVERYWLKRSRLTGALIDFKPIILHHEEPSYRFTIGDFGVKKINLLQRIIKWMT